MILRRVLLVFTMGLCGLVLDPALARAGTKDELRAVESQLSERKQQEAALDRQANTASENLQGLRQQLIAVTESLQAKVEDEERLENKLDDMEQDIEARDAALKGEKKKLGLLTAALVELARQPPQSFFLQTGLASDHIHRSILLHALLPRLREQTEAMARNLAALIELQAQMDNQKNLVMAAQHNLAGQQHELDQLIKARQGLYQRTEAQKDAMEKQLVSLSSEAKDLRELLEKITPKHAPKAGPRQALQAALRPPVVGTIIRKFGDKDTDGVISQGLTYVALSGSPVVAPRAGRVVFAGLFRGYGKILILQHDGGYHSFLAGFGRIDADMGQDVDAGEPLGVLPVKAGAAKPELYFEWRRSNEPVDPGGRIALSKNH